MSNLNFIYRFEFETGIVKEFKIEVSIDTMTTINKNVQNPPDWTRLKNFKCSHCPLDEEKHLYCPLALSLVDTISEFNNNNSFDRVNITVVTNKRKYYQETDLQSGIGSYLGIVMVASGCPIMKKLSPLLHFHLPFATLEETEIRVFSLYLLAQVIKLKEGKEPDWEMINLNKLYDDIITLNHNVSKKIANLESKDANINSIVLLNSFADFVSFTLNEKLINELSVYLKEFID